MCNELHHGNILTALRTATLSHILTLVWISSSETVIEPAKQEFPCEMECDAAPPVPRQLLFKKAFPKSFCPISPFNILVTKPKVEASPANLQLLNSLMSSADAALSPFSKMASYSNRYLEESHLLSYL
ncbi:hypothetical protein AtEden1_Chr1g0062271 [Arabidopsis thaliana]